MAEVYINDTRRELNLMHRGGYMAVDYKEAVLNLYKHKECGTHWADLWSCGCNDECPKCGGEIEPYLSLTVLDIEVMHEV